MIQQLFPNGVEHYFVGGLIVGAGIALLYVLTGRIGGMSSVFTTTWSYFSRAAYFAQERFTSARAWRLAYAFGLVLGGIAFVLQTAQTGEPRSTGIPFWQLGVGGALVGFGARMANGCTSGHGICGLASLKGSSLAAVVTFMIAAIVTAHLVAMLGAHR